MFGSNKQLTLFTNISQKKNHFSAQHHPTSHLICDLKYKRSEITAYLVTVMLIKAFCPLFLLFSIRHHLLISAFEWPTWWIRSHHPGNCSRQEVKRNDCQWIKMATKKMLESADYMKKHWNIVYYFYIIIFSFCVLMLDMARSVDEQIKWS